MHVGKIVTLQKYLQCDRKLKGCIYGNNDYQFKPYNDCKAMPFGKALNDGFLIDKF